MRRGSPNRPRRIAALCLERRLARRISGANRRDGSRQARFHNSKSWNSGFRLSRRGRDARLARSLDESGQLSLENRPFNLVRVIALAIERRGDLREPRDATRPRQLKRAFDSGHLLIHAARLIRDLRRKRGGRSRDLTSFRKPQEPGPFNRHRMRLRPPRSRRA